ncbi:hypothetical protein [Gloeocapsa sp. PCC 73106]|uniref:hypothetical protein n=1 Tax=Gloeocapsa sp. PCC 73106 TaxID=102232 RepID=UPI0002AC25A5|nr:hypothetical protein [Gloeocapsa sp. PCC 73106]ELR99314.1 hypothetical protein GLO73106DRAFT_00031640 [Gloeocapsa sp. PCC 73106]
MIRQLKIITLLLGIFLLNREATASLSCGANVDQLTEQLLRDLPNYTNRVIRSAQSLERDQLQIRHLILASKPEFEPISLSQTQYRPVFNDSPPQVFFTTLERRYINRQPVETQGFHWLFLTETPQGWRFVMLFSSQDTTNTDQPPSPPRDSNQTAIAQAIRLWLRDCHGSS